jgi:hypothetical protein
MESKVTRPSSPISVCLRANRRRIRFFLAGGSLLGAQAQRRSLATEYEYL